MCVEKEIKSDVAKNYNNYIFLNTFYTCTVSIFKALNAVTGIFFTVLALK